MDTNGREYGPNGGQATDLRGWIRLLKERSVVKPRSGEIFVA